MFIRVLSLCSLLSLNIQLLVNVEDISGLFSTTISNLRGTIKDIGTGLVLEIINVLSLITISYVSLVFFNDFKILLKSVNNY